MSTAYVVMLPQRWAQLRVGGKPSSKPTVPGSTFFLVGFDDRERAIEFAEGHEMYVSEMTITSLIGALDEADKELG